MFIPSTFKRPVSSWKALNLRKTLLMASSVQLKPLNCSRLPCVYAQETLTRSEERFSRNAETDLVCRLLLEKKREIASRNTSENKLLIWGMQNSENFIYY